MLNSRVVLAAIVYLAIALALPTAHGATQTFTDRTAFAAVTAHPTTIQFSGILPEDSQFQGFNRLIVSGVSFSTPLSGVNVNVTKATYYSPNDYPADFIVNSSNQSSNELVISFPTPTKALAFDYGGLGFRGSSVATITLSNGFVFTANLPTVGNTQFVGFVSTDSISSLTLFASNDDWVVLDVITAGTSATARGVRATDLIVPNYGLNAIQELDPATGAIVQTIPIPAPYTLQGSIMLLSALVRTSDNAIFLNVRDGSGYPTVLVLNSQGQFLTAQPVGSQSGGYLQQIVFDPLDGTQGTVLGGVPFFPEVRSINPFTATVATRVSLPSSNVIGLATGSRGQIYVGDYASGRIFLYTNAGQLLSTFVDVGLTTGSSEINGLARDDNGNLYVAQNNSNRISKFDSSGIFLGFLVAPSFDHPYTVFWNPLNGWLYVGNQGSGNLTV